MVGELNFARRNPSVIFAGKHFLVVGGEELDKIEFSYEKCFYENNTMTCTAEKALQTNHWRPLLYQIGDDFLNKCDDNSVTIVYDA